MSKITFQQKTYTSDKDEVVLETLLRAGINVPFSCRGGSCHVCMMRSDNHASIPGKAQNGLNQTLVEKGYFLPCVCQPKDDLSIMPPEAADLFSRVTVYKKELLSENVVRLLLAPATPLYYHPGQYINLWRGDGVARSYSLASVPREDEYLELYISRQPNGNLSNWIFDKLTPKSRLEIQGPQGQCFYRYQQHAGKNLLLVGTGTGLAPLIAIVRDALLSGHNSNPIYLYHASADKAGLYLHDKCLQLMHEHENFHYLPCIKEISEDAKLLTGDVESIVLSRHTDLTGWGIFICGNPGMVESLTVRVKNCGANHQDIYTDAFNVASQRNEPEISDKKTQYPKPNLKMWQDLKQGELLKILLKDFYAIAFKDEKLSPFFKGTTQEHAIGKQYSFLYKVFTGGDVYFGENMRNAHHWMVISDEIFDYREDLMENILRQYDLSDEFIRQWRDVSAHFRQDIVKSKAVNRVIDGIELPIEGFEMMILDVGAVCDNCQCHLEAGEKVRYHVRMGNIYCSACQIDESC